MIVMTLFYIIIAVMGLYMIAAGLKMKKTGEVSPLLLAEEEQSKCKDAKGFAGYIYWKEVLLGTVMVVVGILGCINELLYDLGIVNTAAMLVFLAVCLWFFRELGSARELYLSKF